MATPNQMGWDFSKMLQLNEINYPDKSNKIFNQSGGQSVLDWIITQNAPARRTYGKDGAFEVPIIGDTNRVAEVLSNSTVGTTLKVNFVDSTYDLFRVGEVITDGSAGRYTGRIISKGLGYVILQATPDITAWSTATHFVAGTYATDAWVATPNISPNGPTSIFSVPKYVKFLTSPIREAITLHENDLMSTWINPDKGIFAPNQVDVMLERVANAKEMKALFSKYGQQLEGDGTVNYSSGFFESVKDPVTGGIYRPMGNIPTYDDFTEFAGSIADRRNDAKTKLKFLVGRKALGVIQNFPKISEQIKHVGINNTFGGVNVNGYDVYNYSFEGIDIELMMLPTLNNIRKFPGQSSLTGTGTREQYTIMCVDLQYRATKDGDNVPAVEKVYFGEREEIMGVVRGSVAPFALGGSTAQSGIIQGANSSDAVTLDYKSNCAYRWLTYYGGLMELAL